MKVSRRHSLCVWLVLVAGAVAVVGYHASRRHGAVTPRRAAPADAEDAGAWRFGLVRVDRNVRTVSFPATVARRSGSVSFLIYVRGYKWLKDECAIVSAAELADVQTALAALDWRLWDFLWTGGAEGEAPPQTPRIEVIWQGGHCNARRLIADPEGLGARDLLFFGSPALDPMVLGADAQQTCESCPLLPLERAHLREAFKQAGRGERCELNAELMPERGTEVTVIIHARGD